MTRELLIMRHCKSSWSDDALPDIERPLNARGKADAVAMGRLLAERRLLPDLAITSPAKRARSTLKRVAAAANYDGDTRVEQDLYESSPLRVLELVASIASRYQRAMVVGHNPTLEEFVRLLTGSVVALPTGTVAWLSLPVEHWSELAKRPAGALKGLFSPGTIQGKGT